MPLQSIPEVLYGVEVGASWWMWEDGDAVLSQEVLSDSCCVRAGVVLLEQAIWVSLKKGHNMWAQNFIDVPVSIDAISLALA